MDDLTRFAIGWALLLVLIAAARLLGPMIVAHLLALAFRRIARFPD